MIFCFQVLFIDPYIIYIYYKTFLRRRLGNDSLKGHTEHTYYEKKLSRVQVKIRPIPTAHEQRYTYPVIFRCRRGWRTSKYVLPFWMWVYSGYVYARSEESVLSSRPCFKTMYEYNHFILGNRLLCWYNTNHHAALAHTSAEKHEKEQHLTVENTASSSKQYFFLEYLVSLFKEPADKKKQDRGKETGEATTVVPGIRITSRTHWTTLNKLEAGPAAKGRDNEGQMRRSHVWFFGLVATCEVPGTCPTQTLPLFFNLIQMGPW